MRGGRSSPYLGHRREDDDRDHVQARPARLRDLARRWVVEWTFVWISKHRRIIRDYESLPASHEAMIL